MFNIAGLETKPLPLYRKDLEQALFRIPGVTEVQVFAKVLVRCEFPMSEETMTELQCTHAQIEYETGWKVEMTISAGKRPEPISVIDIVFPDMLKYVSETIPDDHRKEQDSLHARVAAWEEEHPGKSFWDGAMADSR